jgi:biotin carboxylase
VSKRRVLVVGTTPDYVDIIVRRFPGRTVFLTDARVRAKATEPCPDQVTELQFDLKRPGEAIAALRAHVERHAIHVTGVACFDCESMALAAQIAQLLSLPYPSLESVAACRSKFASKRLWLAAGVPCPKAEAVDSLAAALAFQESLRAPVVLKPLTGSGSELTFVCRNPEECAAAFYTLKSGLADHPDARMYATDERIGLDPKQVFVIEEYVQGQEYSCDFVLEDHRAEVIRTAKKAPAGRQSFGTTLAYLVPAELPPEIDFNGFRQQLSRAATSLGIERAICMMDFFVRSGSVVMIEIAPRPGGDCLPPLLLKCCGLDILGAALDFAEQRPVRIPTPPEWKRLVGLRLFAERGGRIARIDDRLIREDPRVLECELLHEPGHTVVLPPRDYSSRLLGYVIFAPRTTGNIEAECAEIDAKLGIEFEAP